MPCHAAAPPARRLGIAVRRTMRQTTNTNASKTTPSQARPSRARPQEAAPAREFPDTTCPLSKQKKFVALCFNSLWKKKHKSFKCGMCSHQFRSVVLLCRKVHQVRNIATSFGSSVCALWKVTVLSLYRPGLLFVSLSR